MTAQECGLWLVQYYGPYKEEVHKRAVWDFLKGKNRRYCAAMRQCLEAVRPPNWHPPSQKDLRDLHAEAVRKMDLLPVETILPMIEASQEERAGPEDVAEIHRTIENLARRKQG